MKTLPFLLLLFAFAPAQRYVYICDSEYATKYHLVDDCRGLSNCKSDIVQVTLDEARDYYDRSLCGWED